MMQIRAVILLLIFSESVLGGVRRDDEFGVTVPSDDSNSKKFEMSHREKRGIKLDMPIKTRYNRDISDSTDYSSQPDEKNSYEVTEPSYDTRTECSTHMSVSKNHHGLSSNPFFKIFSIIKSAIKFIMDIPLSILRCIYETFYKKRY